MKKPSDILPGTRMPAFWPDYPKSFYPQLGGNAEAQIRAIRDHMLTFRGGPESEGRRGEDGEQRYGREGLEGLEGLDGHEGLEGLEGLEGPEGLDGRERMVAAAAATDWWPAAGLSARS